MKLNPSVSPEDFFNLNEFTRVIYCFIQCHPELVEGYKRFKIYLSTYYIRSRWHSWYHSDTAVLRVEESSKNIIFLLLMKSDNSLWLASLEKSKILCIFISQKQNVNKKSKNKNIMKTKLFLLVVLFASISISTQAQYHISVNYGNVDWIPKNNKVLVYENVFVFQSYNFGKTGLSIFEATSLTKAPNQYELGGINYGKTLGKFKVRVGFHGYFPKSSMFNYTDKGNLIPNIGITWIADDKQNLTSNTFQYWDYKMTSNFFVSNIVYKKSCKFGNFETGQYYNFKTKSLSGSVAYSKSWQIYDKISGFASIRYSFNESKVKLNDSNAIIVNIGIRL